MPTKTDVTPEESTPAEDAEPLSIIGKPLMKVDAIVLRLHLLKQLPKVGIVRLWRLVQRKRLEIDLFQLHMSHDQGFEVCRAAVGPARFLER